MQVLLFLIVNKARFVIEIVDTKYELGLPKKGMGSKGPKTSPKNLLILMRSGLKNNMWNKLPTTSLAPACFALEAHVLLH